MKLYELAAQYEAVLELIQEGGDYLDTLEAIEDAISEKLESIAAIRQTLLAESEALKKEEERIAARRKYLENEASRLKEYAEHHMKETGIDKVKGKLFTLSMRKAPPSVEITDEELFIKSFPSYVEHQPKINKRQLLADSKQNLNDGKEYIGAGFKIINNKKVLNIR